ncbi:MAG TPA: GspH/FimT family pseudopilin [Gemmatimonadales bacterium]|nr:GspH/FimT family pseudopilin [Gemmatimonadales bacterium]
MRKGYTLVELLLVVVLVGLLSLLGMRSAADLRDRLLVDQAARRLVDAHLRAQLLAATEHRVMLLVLRPDSIILAARISPADTASRWRQPGPGSLEVASTGLPKQVAFAPSGIPLGIANNTYTLTRGRARRQVIVSRYGRIQWR